jgi:hypothetical protein
MATTTISPHAPSDVLLAMLVEAGGLALVVTIAGISDRMATMMLILVIGIWLLWGLKHASALTQINTGLNNILKVG